MLNRVLSILPEDLRKQTEMCSQRISAAYTYVFSKHGNEVDDVIDKLFEMFQSKVEDNFETPEVEAKVFPSLGYICLSGGRVSGLNTIRKVGKAWVTQLENLTQITVLNDFQNLKMD